MVYAVYWSAWLAQTTSIPLPSALSEEKSLSVVAAATATAVGNLTYGSTVRIAYNAAEKSRGNPRIISTTSYQVQFIMRKSILSSDSATS